MDREKELAEMCVAGTQKNGKLEILRIVGEGITEKYLT